MIKRLRRIAHDLQGHPSPELKPHPHLADVYLCSCGFSISQSFIDNYVPPIRFKVERGTEIHLAIGLTEEQTRMIEEHKAGTPLEVNREEFLRPERGVIRRGV